MVRLPIEITAVTLLVCVRKLQQSFAAHGPSAHFVVFRDFWLGVTDAGVRIQAGFSTRKCLEEVGPKCAFVCFAHLVKSRAESTDIVRDLRRKHFGRQRLLDDLVPLWIPGRPSKLDLLLIDRGRRGWFGGLGTRSCGYSHEKYETHDERCLQRRRTHVYRPRLFFSLWLRLQPEMAIPAWAVSQGDGGHGAAAGCAQPVLPSAAERL